jgi:ABC-2 type transport system permease protein
MNKTWLVIKHEYLKHVKKKRFILAIFSLPFFILLMVGVGFLAVVIQYDDTPVGYIDQSGILSNPIEFQSEPPIGFLKPMEMLPFSNSVEADNALQQNLIQAYYQLDDNFLQTNEIEVFANKQPDSEINSDFLAFLRMNLLKDAPEKLSDRIINGSNFQVKSIDGSKQSSEENFLDIILPLISGFLFIMAINISGGYLLQAVVEEKENRTMEIMVTSVSPLQLMTAKVIGNLSVGLTQLVVWILFAILGINIIFRIYPNLQTTQLDLQYLILTIVVFIPAFIMVAAMMAALGATTTETREAQQVAGLFTIPMVAPFWFLQVLMEHPDSPLSIFLSLFPFTAPVSLPIRAAFANIPIWQLAITILLLILFSIVSLWLAGKSFRLGMLRYGKKISLKEIITQRP